MQTNYDREYPDPLHDPRRVPVELRLRERGNINFQEGEMMENYLSIWPTFNIGTILSTVMEPARGYHNSTIWYGQNPAIKQ